MFAGMFTPNQLPPGLPWAAGCWLVGLLLYLLGYRQSASRYEAIVEVPTVRCRDVPGLGAAMVEVKGAAVAKMPVVSDLARVPCVAFNCSVTEHWTTTRTEQDSQGKTRTVTEHHSETRYSNARQIPFNVRDESGEVLVRPEGSSMDMLDSMGAIDGPLPDSPAYGMSPSHFGGSLSYSECVLPVGQSVYVLGQVDGECAIVRPELIRRPFIISWRTEESLRSRAAWGKSIWGALVMAFVAAGFVVIAVLQ